MRGLRKQKYSVHVISVYVEEEQLVQRRLITFEP